MSKKKDGVRWSVGGSGEAGHHHLINKRFFVAT